MDRKVVETRPNGDIKTTITEWGKVTSLISTRYDAMLDTNVSVFEQSLTYDEAGNVTHEVRKQNDVITTIDNLYNSRGELTQSSQETGLNKVVYQYTMSPFGNKSENIDYYANGEFALRESKAYVYNHLNQLESSTIDGITVEYDYDDYGNLVEESNGTYTKTYAYDLNNRLIEVIEGSQALQFSYDGSGNRLSKSINAIEVNYVNDTSIENEQVLSYKVGNDVTNIIFGLGRLNEDGVGYLSDSYGNIIQHGSESYAYTPYGELTLGIIDGVNEAGYKGEIHDSSSLQYLRARTYNAKLKQFLSEDTYIGKDAHPLSQNRYAFVLNNPYKYSDPSGHIALPYEKEDKGYSGNYKPLKTISKTNSKGTTNVPKAVIHKKLEQLYTDEIKQTKTSQQVKLEHTQQILAKNEETYRDKSESAREKVEEQIKYREKLQEARKQITETKTQEVRKTNQQTDERNKLVQVGSTAAMIGFGALMGVAALIAIPAGLMILGGITAGAIVTTLLGVGVTSGIIGVAAGLTLHNTGSKGIDLAGRSLTNKESQNRKSAGNGIMLSNTINLLGLTLGAMDYYNANKPTVTSNTSSSNTNQESKDSSTSSNKTWNQFQSENKGKYTNEEMSKEWAQYKQDNGFSNNVTSSTHGNSLTNSKTNYGYQLIEKDTGEVLKYGETLYPESRYSGKYLDSNNAYMEVLTSGSKYDIHMWQRNSILEYTKVYNEMPPLNMNGW